MKTKHNDNLEEKNFLLLILKEEKEKTNLIKENLNISENINKEIISIKSLHNQIIEEEKTEYEKSLKQKLINKLDCNNKNFNIDYSTINVNTKLHNEKEKSEQSIIMNENTTNFDLYKGLIYMFLSCISKSLFSILCKFTLKTIKNLSSFQLLTFRTYYMLWISVVVSFALPFSIFSQKFIKSNKILPVFIRTIFAILSMSLVVYSLKFMHISDVYSVYYIYPAFIIIFSFIFLKEKITYFDICCLFACFVGAILIVKPNFIFVSNSNKKSEGFFFLFVIIAALLKATEDVIIRNIGADINFLIVPCMYSFVGMILFPIPMFIYDTVYPTLTLYDNFIIFLIAIFSFLYMAFMTLGFQNENAGRVSMINYFQVVLMYLSDLFLFNRKLQVLDLMGTMLIFGFNFTNGLIKAFKRFDNLEKHKNKNFDNNGDFNKQNH
jgi:drug/metabolite transporter (DMT)-like permease